MMSDRGKLFLAGSICFCAGGLYGWSALIVALQQAFSISAAEAGFVFSMAVVAFSVAVLASPLLPRTLQDLRGLAILGMGAAMWLCLSAFAPNYQFFVLFFALGFGASSGAIYMGTLALASQTSNPKVATPVVIAAFGLGGAIFGPVWRVLVESDSGLLSLLVLPVILVIVSSVTLLKTKQNIASEGVEISELQKGIFGEPSTYAVLMIWCIFAFGSIGGLMVLGLASKILDAAGSSVLLSSIALAGIAIGNTSGRLSVAGFNQFLNPITVAGLAVVVGGAGLLLAVFSEGAGLVSVALILVALGYGVIASSVPSITGLLFGSRYFARVFSIIFTAWGAAGLSAPWIAGAIFDRTGSFQGAIYAALGATLVSGLLVVILQRVVATKQPKHSLSDYIS